MSIEIPFEQVSADKNTFMLHSFDIFPVAHYITLFLQLSFWKEEIVFSYSRGDIFTNELYLSKNWSHGYFIQNSVPVYALPQCSRYAI